ncbi:MAG TPA: extracellular solute-binding protein [Candidatus Limnocylindrales bacterium]|nr:extracellular solute-binding protein [Candidatus Limnocylindrales bacterium]
MPSLRSTRQAALSSMHRPVALLASLALVMAACTGPSGGPGGSPAGSPGGAGRTPVAGKVNWVSTQLRPVEEAEKVRSQILAGYSGQVEFIAEEEGPLQDRVKAEAQAGKGSIDVIGALHGDFATLAEAGTLTPLGDLAGSVGTIDADYLELAKLGGDQAVYIPWMQATYIMVANKEALQYLPQGADVNALTYEQLGAWGKAIKDATGQQKLGFPLGEKGLFHRLLQGYTYPSYTGGQVVGFESADAVKMYQDLKVIWESVHPQAQTYEFMQEPLLAGEVWVAWDHTARLIEALKARPDDFVAFPAPAGPKGRGYMPVLAGLAIPKNAPDAAGARALIEFLLKPETQTKTLQQVAFFPVVEGATSDALDPGTRLEADAVAATQEASDAVAALLPVGIGAKGGELNKVYRDAFTRIVLQGEAAETVLAEEAPKLQAILDAQSAACWPPDPPSDGACKIQ